MKHQIITLLLLFSFSRQEAYSFISRSDTCVFLVPDTSLNGIGLHKPTSDLAGLGKALRVVDGPIGASYSFVALDNKQKITFIAHPGSSKTDFSEIIVETNHEYFYKSKFQFAKTEKGIQLGLTKQKIIQLLGECYKHSTDGKNEVILYVITDYEKSAFLKHYNMPLYHAEYTFRDNKLIKFRFGFDQP